MQLETEEEMAGGNIMGSEPKKWVQYLWIMIGILVISNSNHRIWKLNHAAEETQLYGNVI
jgi:hypothetical protein